MGILTAYYFDTYAWHEIIEGNPSYERFKEDVRPITIRMNLMELYYGLIRVGRKEQAEECYDELLNHIVLFSDETIKEAMEFRLKYKKKKLSYTDSLGYIIAKKHKVKFLTGDEGFKDLPNVEFVK